MARINNYFSGRTSYVPYEKTVTVTENRASTDESLSLLNEIQEKAKENLISQVTVRNSILEIKGMVFISNIGSFKYEVYAKFAINNHEFVVKKDIELYSTPANNHSWQTEVVTLVYQKLSEKITKALMETYIKEFDIKP